MSDHGHGYAFKCETCDGEPMWRIERVGDVVTTWACAEHLSEACDRLQRDYEVTQLTVILSAKAREWAELTRALERIAAESGHPDD